MAERITVVSADGHAGCSPEHYRPYIDPAYRDRIGEPEREEQVMRTAMGFVRGGLMQPGVSEVGEECLDLYSNAKKRLAEQDAQGIAAELLISGTDHAGPFCFAANRSYPEDVRAAGLRTTTVGWLIWPVRRAAGCCRTAIPATSLISMRLWPS